MICKSNQLFVNQIFRYHDASRRLAAMVADKPISSRQRLIKYVEFTAKYGPIKNYDIAGNRLNFIQYYSLDIIMPVFVIVSTVAYLNIRILLCIWRCFFKKPKMKDD